MQKIVKYISMFLLITMLVITFCAPALYADEDAKKVDELTRKERKLTGNERELFEEGGRLFMAKKYAKARDKYEELISRGYKDPSVYFNLSNAYVYLGATGKAVLNLRRAKRLQPRSRDILKNINVLSAFVLKGSIKTDEKLAKDLLVKDLTKNEIAVVILVSYLLFFLFAFIKKIVKTNKIRITASIFTAASYLLTLLFLFLFIASFYYDNLRPQAVIMKNAAVMSMPLENDGNKRNYELKEGMIVEINKTYNGWGEVIIGGSKAGWVRLDSLEKV